MTRKRYNKKIRALIVAMNSIPGSRKVKDIRPGSLRFGVEITYGKYSGKSLNSYEMAWDMLKEFLRDCKGLEKVFQ